MSLSDPAIDINDKIGSRLSLFESDDVIVTSQNMCSLGG